MKKIIILILCSVFLCGCGIIGENGIEGAFGSDAAITAPSVSDENTEPETVEGGIGETMHTMFYDYTVRNASLAAEINGQTPSTEDSQYLIVDLIVKNTTETDFSMFSDDFFLYYGSGENDYALPRISDAPEVFLTESELPDEYELKAGESADGQLVFEVPNGLDYFIISAEDVYTDENGEVGYGDFYDVYIDLSE